MNVAKKQNWNAKRQIKSTETFNWHNLVLIHWMLLPDKFNQWGHTKIDTTWAIRRSCGPMPFRSDSVLLMNEFVQFVFFLMTQLVVPRRFLLYTVEFEFCFNFMVGCHLKFWWKSNETDIRECGILYTHNRSEISQRLGKINPLLWVQALRQNLWAMFFCRC